MTLACAGTPYVANPDNLHKFVWWGFQNLSSTLLAALTEPVPWLGSLVANRLLSLDNLCSQNLEVPDAWINDDYAGIVGSILESGAFPSVAFMTKLEQYIQYAAFEQYCSCAAPSSPPPFTPAGGDAGLGRVGCASFVALGASNPSSACLYGCTYYVNINKLTASTNTATVWISERSAWPTGYNGTWTCPPSDGRWTQIPATWSAPLSGPTRYEMTNVGQFGPFTGTTMCAPGLGDPSNGIALMVTAPGDTISGGPSTWNQVGSNYTIVCLPAPPPSTPAPDISLPTAPPLACDAGTLCAIQWQNYNSQVNNARYDSNTNTTVTNISIGSTPVATTQVYVPGTSHLVSGSGVVSVSQPVGIIVQPGGFSAGIGSAGADPTYYYDAGWIAFGNAQGWLAHQRVEHNPQVFLTSLQDVTQVGYDCERSTSYTITELVIPPPVPPAGSP